MGTDDFHKKRKERNIKRKRVEKKAVLIALEDTKSSKYYFQKLLQDKGLIGAVTIASHRGTNPKNVLQAIKDYKEKNPRKIFEKEWILIDKDDWGKDEFNGIIDTARKTNICVAFSNEAYELWLLLHFERITAFTNRKKLNSKLSKYFNNNFKISYEKSARDIYQLIIDRQQDAIKNANYLVSMHKRDNGDIIPYLQNPLTMVHQLVKCLNKLNTIRTCDCYPLS